MRVADWLFARPYVLRTLSNGVRVGILGFVTPDTVASVIGHPTPVPAGALMPDNVFHAVVGIIFLAVGAMKPPATA